VPLKNYEISENFRIDEKEICVLVPEEDDIITLENILENLSNICNEYQKNNRSCEE